MSHHSTLFQERMEHFAKEKRFLAQNFGVILIERLKELCKGKQDTILFIDAGTTLLPFFEVLNYHLSKDKITNRKFVIVTNNLAGINWLSTTKDAIDENGELILNCVQLPGELLPTYNAITGFGDTIGSSFIETLAQLNTNNSIEMIRKLRDESKRKIKIISLVTGNWVRIRNSTPQLPVPLARGRGHLDVKESMIKNSDEVYVISPLGKIFSGSDRTVIFKLLKKYSDSYEELDTGKTKLKIVNQNRTKIKLITTYRPTSNFLLARSSDMIYSSLSNKDSTKDSDSKPHIIRINEKNFESYKDKFKHYDTADIPHCMFNFKDVSADEKVQLTEEFPHSYCHNKDVLEYFHVFKTESHRWL